MPILSSRPTQQTPVEDVVKASRPTINILNLLTDLVKLHDDTMLTLMNTKALVLDVLEAMELDDFVVSPLPGTARVVLFEVGVKPVNCNSFVIFRIAFDIV